jgi:hypothetical protein
MILPLYKRSILTHKHTQASAQARTHTHTHTHTIFFVLFKEAIKR